MGLDVILGGLVLIAAVRGWFQGFVLQAIRLAGLVACVYEAGPLRDLARPYVQGYLAGLRPELLDRLLWWAGCVVAYVVTVGLATWLVRLYRRTSYGEPDPYRGDQAAGFLLGAAKGLLVTIFLAAAIDRYALGYLNRIEWVASQASQSRALVWTQAYRPAEQVWAAPPVRRLVAHVQMMGLSQPSGSEPSPAAAQARGASRPRTLAGPRPAQPAPPAELDPELEDLRRELHGLEDGNWR
jgi:hypothetical protein